MLKLHNNGAWNGNERITKSGRWCSFLPKQNWRIVTGESCTRKPRITAWQYYRIYPIHKKKSRDDIPTGGKGFIGSKQISVSSRLALSSLQVKALGRGSQAHLIPSHPGWICPRRQRNHLCDTPIQNISKVLDLLLTRCITCTKYLTRQNKEGASLFFPSLHWNILWLMAKSNATSRPLSLSMIQQHATSSVRKRDQLREVLVVLRGSTNKPIL